MDVNNYLSFFKSANGGAWDDTEIVPKHFDWTVLGLSSEIYSRRMDGLDYVLIVFAGHGYAIRGGTPYFELSENEDVSLETIRSWFPAQKVMMIADSCQCYINLLAEGGRLQDRTFSQHHDSNQRELFRKAYNKQIEDVSYHAFTFVSSVSSGEAANDTSLGGLYSKSLLDISQSIIRQSQLSFNKVYDIKQIHNLASEAVSKKTGGKQNPYIHTTSVTVYPPFIVV